jgi:uncharacterized protein (TIGR02145 family)
MSSLSDKKQEFRSLLIKDEVIRTIHTLKEFMFDTCEKYDRLILIEAHFNQVLRRKHANTISYENLSLEEGRTREKLLEIINGLEETDYPLIDPRDGKRYNKIELNGKFWMTKNLNFDVGEECCFFKDDLQNGRKYGRLYTWEAANKACPPGWRLPTDEEWKSLMRSFGGYYDGEIETDIGDPQKGYAAITEDDSTGLSTQLGGFRNSNGNFLGLGAGGFYWSATEDGSDYAWCYGVARPRGRLFRSRSDRLSGRSCRCVQDSSI